MSLEQIKNQSPVIVVIILATILIIGAIQVGPRSMDFDDRRVGMPGENKMGKPMEKFGDRPNINNPAARQVYEAPKNQRMVG